MTTSTTFTEDELATRVLREIGIVESGEAPSNIDLVWAKETNASEIALLAAIQMPIWNGSYLSVPLEYYTTLARRLALAVAPSFGIVDLAKAQMAIDAADRTLSLLAAPRMFNPRPLRADDAIQRRASFDFTTGQ